jgi:hypothetical protein
METTMTDQAILLATHARRVALTRVVRAQPELTIEQLDVLLTRSKYRAELRRITVGELLSNGRAAIVVRRRESFEDAALRVFRRHADEGFATGFFMRYMSLERWQAQAMLAGLVDRGLLIRSGRTSGTRYRLAILA